MEIPKELIDKFKEGDKKFLENKKRKQSSLHYKRRKLDKDVKAYIKGNTRYRSRDLERIGRNHGFHIGSTPFREDPTPHEDA